MIEENQNKKYLKMSKRVSPQSLVHLLRITDKIVRPGVWLHKQSGIKYRVLSLKVLDERTIQPLILYTKQEYSGITWARLEKDFLKSFISLEDQN